MKHTSILSLVFLALLMLQTQCTTMPFAEIANITVNHYVNPLGVDRDAVRFGWQMNSNIIGQEQKSYQIVVRKDSPTGTVVWDTDVVADNLSTGIQYRGERLELETRYFWQVTVTPKFGDAITSGDAQFMTGADWNDVSWVMPAKRNNGTGDNQPSITNRISDPVAMASGNTYLVYAGTAADDDLGAQMGTREHFMDLWGYAPVGNTTPNGHDDYANIFGVTDNYVRMGGNPLLRTEAKLSKPGKLVSATLYMTGLGNYRAYINGQKVFMADTRGELVEPMFAPGFTDYNSFINYQTYDVKEYLSKSTDGQFVLGAEMYKGPYAGRVGANYYGSLDTWNETVETNDPERLISPLTQYVPFTNNPTRNMGLIAKLVVEYDDGTKQSFGSNPSDWRTVAGPVLFNDYYMGELFDANKAKKLEGWNNVGFDATGWIPAEDGISYPVAQLRPNNGAVARYADEYDRHPINGFMFRSNARGTLRPVPAEPLVSITSPIPGGPELPRGSVSKHPINLTGLNNGTGNLTIGFGERVVLNFGQNTVGIVELLLTGDPNAIVRVRHGEMLNDGSEKVNDAFNANWVAVDENTANNASGPVGIGAAGLLYYDAMRGDDGQVSFYKLSDKTSQKWQPFTTYHGFQYVEISTDTPGATVTILGVTAKMITSAHHRLTELTTNDPLVNRLIENSFWGQKGNWTTIPTDCPQRSERVGWSGDAQLFAQTAIYNFDAIPFYENYIQIMNANIGRFNTYGQVMPGGWSDNNQNQGVHCGWSDAGIIIPWTLYHETGDKYIIESSFEDMDRYMDRVYGDGPGKIGFSPNVNVSVDAGALNEQGRPSHITMETRRWNNYHTSMYGDWVSFQGAHINYVNLVFQIYTTMLMRDMATITGNTAAVAKYTGRYEELKDIFLLPPVIVEVSKTEPSRPGIGGNNPEGKVRIDGGFVYDAETAAKWGMKDGDLMSYGPLSANVQAFADNAQTALVWALKCGLYRDEEHRQHLINRLLENIRNEGSKFRSDFIENTLSVGFLGVNALLPVTSDVGYSNVAYDLLMQEAMPGWMYSVISGASTSWELWNSYSWEYGFGPSGMNSFNHFSYGCVNEWMYEYMAGVKKNPTVPAHKEFILQPKPDVNFNRTTTIGDGNAVITLADGTRVKMENGRRVNHVNFFYDSSYGRIVSNWTAPKGKIETYRTVIPANTSATLYLPVNEVHDTPTVPQGVIYKGTSIHNGLNVAVFELSSGAYDFTISETGVIKAKITRGYVQWSS